MLKKVGVQGRIPTEKGRKAFHELHAEAMLRETGDELLRTLTRGDKQHLLDLLEARLCLEGRAAALAARCAGQKTVDLLDELVVRQEKSIADGRLGIDEDVRFHTEIATASGNAVVASLVALLREHHRYNRAVTSIRTEVGSQLVVDHGAILDAIKRRDPPAAQQAMETHLRALAADLKQYWTEPARSDTSNHVEPRSPL